MTYEEIYRRLLKFYDEDLMGGDRELMALVREDAPEEKWLARHNAVLGSAVRTDEILNLLAEGLRLVSPPPREKGGRAKGRKTPGRRPRGSGS